jgi:hypothetical protein
MQATHVVTSRGVASRSELRSRAAVLGSALALLVGLHGCGPSTSEPDAEAADAGPPSDASVDVGLDGGPPDSGVPDGGPVTHQVVVRLIGSGSGRVEGAGIQCDETLDAVCDADLPHGARVRFDAYPDVGSVLESWSVTACGHELACELDVDTDLLVTVELVRVPVQLQLEVNGEGRVRTTPPDEDCVGTCDRTYSHGALVALVASPTDGHRFAGWTDACAATTEPTCVLTLEADTTVGAIFAPLDDAVLVVRAGTGDGRIVSSPAGIDCGEDCSETYRRGSHVTLTATAAEGSDFEGWSGDCAGPADCALDVDGARVAVASFRVRRYALDVVHAGDGEGRVTADVGSLDCGGTCSADYGHGTAVTLTATGAPSSTFAGWSGACAGVAPTCTVTMTEARAVTASFGLDRYPLEVSVAGSGTGRVSSAPAGIDCGSTCSASVAHGTRVVLTAAPDPSSTFAGWTGPCAGLATTCELEVTAAQSVTATFAIRRHTLTVVRTGTGAGGVSSDPAGVDCGADCSETYEHGTVVTLSVSADPDSRFVGWTADDGACTGTSPCVLTLDRDREVRAEIRGFEPTLVSPTDRDPAIVVRDDSLAVDFHFAGAARSSRAIAPGSGVFYFEAHRLTDDLGPYGAGVATSSVPVVGGDAYAGFSDQSFGVTVGGSTYYESGYVAGFPGSANDTYGFVVDYRGATPTVHFVARDWGGTPIVVHTQAMPGVTTPLYIMLSGSKRAAGYEIELNPGNDTVNFPFAYDPRAPLRAAGLTAVADALVLGWGGSFAGAPDESPVITTSSDLVVAPGTPVTVTATATDTEDGSLTSALRWELLSTPHYAGRLRGTGGSFSFTPTAIGRHPARVEVRDSAGQRSEAIVMVRVEAPLPQAATVRLEHDPRAGAGIELSADGLSARWTGLGKMGIRANQSNYGRFWYFEIQRLIDPANQGGGVVIGAGNLDPYDWYDVPPSCSINTTGSAWRNIIWQTSFPNPDPRTYDHYGFAVDYRGGHPIVYIIVGGQVVRELYLDDVWVELYPVIYGNPQGTPAGSFDEAINFGASPFFYDAAAALVAHGVDVSGFELGWGDANLP